MLRRPVFFFLNALESHCHRLAGLNVNGSRRRAILGWRNGRWMFPWPSRREMSWLNLTLSLYENIKYLVFLCYRIRVSLQKVIAVTITKRIRTGSVRNSSKSRLTMSLGSNTVWWLNLYRSIIDHLGATGRERERQGCCYDHCAGWTNESHRGKFRFVNHNFNSHKCLCIHISSSSDHMSCQTFDISFYL